jgi:hypothetical protein
MGGSASLSQITAIKVEKMIITMFLRKTPIFSLKIGENRLKQS